MATGIEPLTSTDHYHHYGQEYEMRYPERQEHPRTFGSAIPSKSLYVSHFISTWNSRGFEFGAVLFLAAIYPGTLLPMSLYALIRALAAIALSPWVGRYIDTTDRLSVVRTSIVGQRIPVTLSCLGFWVLLQLRKGDNFPLLSHVVFGCLVLLACLEKLCSVMNTVSVERDWVVVIASQSEEALQTMNSQMRRIDLFCKLVSPLAIALLDGLSTQVAIAVTLGVNAAAVGVEYFLIARVYRLTPALSRQRDEHSVLSNEEIEMLVNSETAHSQIAPRAKIVSVTAYLQEYFRSPAVLPSLSLSILYLTVLSFSGQMTTYLLAVPAPRLNSTSVGLLRTVSTIFELSSTFLAPRLIAAIGAVRAGIWCLSWQALCLSPGVGLLLMGSTDSLPKFLTRADVSSITDAEIGVIVLVVGVMLSRIGLWSFDLVAQLLVQNAIDLKHRGSFSATEASLQNFFELCAFASTIVWSKPEQFKYPALVSLAAIWIAGAYYAKFVRDQRGHLIHLPSCMNFDWSSMLKKSFMPQEYHNVDGEDTGSVFGFAENYSGVQQPRSESS